MPATGIEPVRCLHRRILSPVRLPIPPSRQSEQRDSDPRPLPWQGSVLPAELCSHDAD